MGTASWIEIVWTVAALLGGSVSAFNLRYRIRRYVYVRRQKINGRRKRLSTQHLREEAGCFAIFSIATVLGIWACLTPEPVRQANQDYNIAAGIGLLLILGLTLFRTITEFVDRVKLVDWTEKEDKASHGIDY